MFSTLFPLLSALLVGTSFAAYPPSYLSATGAYGNSCSDCGYVAAFHTGAGTNAAILTNDTGIALTGQFDHTYWTFNGFSTTYSLYMQPTADSEFPDYGNVGINAGYATAGFSEADEDGLLVWNNTDMANVGSFFALCPTLIPGYESAGVQAQLFWQSNEAPIEGTEDCTPVVIHGAYE